MAVVLRLLLFSGSQKLGEPADGKSLSQDDISPNKITTTKMEGGSRMKNTLIVRLADGTALNFKFPDQADQIKMADHV